MIRPRRYLPLAAAALGLLAGALVLGGAPAGATTTVVRPGDTLWQIAATHHVPMEELAAANAMDPNDVLLAGQRLQIPEPRSAGRGQPAPGPSGTLPTRPRVLSRAQLQQQLQFCSQLPAAAPASTRGQLPDRLRSSPGRLALRPRFMYWSQAYSVPPELVQAVAWQESGWQNRVVSRAGAVGIGQLMPNTVTYVAGQLLGTKLKATVPDDNIRMSARLLEQLLSQTGGDRCQAVASYYQGFDTLRRVGVLQETQPYVKNVLALMPRFAQAPRAAGKKSGTALTSIDAQRRRSAPSATP
jgi:soluble lytic murein transglycosylase-like protein